MTAPEITIAVVGSGRPDAPLRDAAEAIGRRLAEAGATVVCGGRDGVMAAAARGARAGGGRPIGILPGEGPDDTPADPSIAVAVYTGIGQARNLAVVLTADAVIAVGGGWGTLSEVALARKHGRPVVLLGGWQLEPPDAMNDPDLHTARDADDAVELALAAATRRRR